MVASLGLRNLPLCLFADCVLAVVAAAAAAAVVAAVAAAVAAAVEGLPRKLLAPVSPGSRWQSPGVAAVTEAPH